MALSLKDATDVSAIEIQASKIIARLEEAVEKATDDAMLYELSDEKDTVLKGKDFSLKGGAWKINQGFLQTKTRSVAQILTLLEDLIVYENNQGCEEGGAVAVTSLAPLSGVAKACLVAHSIAAFANTLDRTHLNNLNNRIHNDTTRWITHLFRFYDSQAFYHEEPLEGLVRLTRMLLHYKYPKYLEVGFECLSSSPPVIYTTTYSSLGIVQHLCRQLGLSLSCVHAIPCVSKILPQQRIDFNSLCKMIQEDKASKKIPLLLLADAGTPITGYVDDVPQLQAICRQENIWLHIKGHGLAALATVTSTNVEPARVADSMSLSVGTWLGVSGVPTVTLFRTMQSESGGAEGEVGTESSPALIAGLVVDQLQKRLVALPLWFALQGFGREEIQKRIREAFERSEMLWERLSKYSCLRLLNHSPGRDAEVLRSQEKMNRPALIFEMAANTVVFQFIPENQALGVQCSSRVPAYYNKLNSWLGQILQQDIPQMNVEICELEHAGLVLRICPLEAIIPISTADVNSFITCLEQQLEILLATVRLKSLFQRSVESNRSLQLVEMEGWAGLGGVRYIPDHLANVDSTSCQQELNKLNVEIVSKLRATDAAFSLGEGKDGLVCVRFGMVTAETDVEELLSLVMSIGKDVEESSKYLDTMVEIVKKGIQTATIDLQKENEERLWQEGILRNVPVFGSLVNWWSPKTKETGIRGRSLNLQAGVVESTENIYRYHMQLQQGASSPPGTKSPPQPLVQTPILTDPPDRHSSSSSSSSSHCSQLSHKSNDLTTTTTTTPTSTPTTTTPTTTTLTTRTTTTSTTTTPTTTTDA